VAKPFLKWAGGKSWLAPLLQKAFTFSKREHYVEPFLGGGSIFLSLAELPMLKRAVLSDVNSELINTYRVVQSSPEALVAELKLLDKEFKSLTHDARAHYYYKMRQHQPKDEVRRAARFIFLNKTCFNGLYRVNKEGLFNVPYGRYEEPKILDTEAIFNASSALKKAVLLSCDFEEISYCVPEDAFVYIDPPYIPLSPTAQFTNYSSGGFTLEDHERLARVARQLASSGCLVVVSNSYHPLVSKLYEGFHPLTVFASRSINSDSNGRGKVPEYLMVSDISLSLVLTEIESYPVFKILERDSLTGRV